MLFIALQYSAVFLALVVGVAYTSRRHGTGLASLCSLAGVVVLFLFTQSLLLTLNALFTAFVAAACWTVGARRRWFLASALAATVAAYGVAARPNLAAWDAVKNDYPLESLAGRLAYEDRPRTAPADGAPDPARLAHLEERFERAEMDFGCFPRAVSLECLHGGVVQQFVNSPGFGVGRIYFRPDPMYLKPGPWQSLATGEPSFRYTADDLPTAHEGNILAFLDPIDFGYARDREHVAGFRPHQFHVQPHTPRRWRLSELDLVGLLKYGGPVVYPTANLWRMDQLAEAPTRPPDSFEEEGLTRLRHGEDLIVRESSERLRALGSLRAVKQCLRCHHAHEGELLGAFSYELAPIQPPSHP